LTAEKARYLLQCREQINSGRLRELSQEVSNRRFNGLCILLWFSLLVADFGTTATRDDGEGIQPPSRTHRSSSTFDGDDDDDDNIEPQSNGYNYLIENTHDMPGPMDFEDNVVDFEDDVDDANEGEGEDHDMDNEGRPTSPQAGQKRTRHYSDADQLEAGEYRKAMKAKDSRGKPKADDWEPEVQDVLAEAIQSYETKLATRGFFPDHMEEVTWAKAAWLDGCRECDVKIHHNAELIKIVRFRFLTLFGANYLYSDSSQVKEHICMALSRPKLGH